MLFVQVHNDFVVAVGFENMSPTLQRIANCAISVKLAVDDRDHRSVFIRDGLRATGRVDNRQTNMAKSYLLIGRKPFPSAVGTTMTNHIERASEPLAVDWHGRNLGNDSTHDYKAGSKKIFAVSPAASASTALSNSSSEKIGPNRSFKTN